MNKVTREDVYKAIDAEREHQDEKYGPNKPQSLPGFLTVLRKELQEAEDGWFYGIEERRNTCLEELVQVAAVAIATLERYGLVGNPVSTNDLSPEGPYGIFPVGARVLWTSINNQYVSVPGTIVRYLQHTRVLVNFDNDREVNCHVDDLEIV